MYSPNDPRVLFAAERTLLAWNRTAMSLMVFGFAIERFGLFLETSGVKEMQAFQRHISFFLGEVLIFTAAFTAIYSVVQHKRILRNMGPEGIPEGYNLHAGTLLNLVTGIIAIVVGVYIGIGFL